MPVMNELVAPAALFNSRYGDGTAELKLSAEDRLNIVDLTLMFEWAFDARRFDALEKILTEDFILDHIFGYRAGKSAALELLRGSVPSNGLRHQATNPLIFINDENEVSVLSYLYVVKVVNDSADRLTLPSPFGHALVTDTIRKENNRWKIARRTFEQMRVPKTLMPLAEQQIHLEPAASQRAAERAGQK